jgi:hypothetical protein
MKDKDREFSKQKFKEMTFKQKIAHIWEYDKIPIFGTLIGGAMLISLLYSMFGPKPPSYAVDIVIAGMATTSFDVMEPNTEVINTQYDAGLTLFTADFENINEMTAAIEQKLLLMVQTGEVDILIASPQKYEGYLNIEGYNIFRALDEEPELAQLLKTYEDKLIVSNNKEKEGKSVFGIRVDALDVFEDIYVGEEMILGVIAYPKDTEKTVEVLKYLLEPSNP